MLNLTLATQPYLWLLIKMWTGFFKYPKKHALTQEPKIK